VIGWTAADSVAANVVDWMDENAPEEILERIQPPPSLSDTGGMSHTASMGYIRPYDPNIFDLARSLREGALRDEEPPAPAPVPPVALEDADSVALAAYQREPIPTGLDALDALAAAAWRLEVPFPHERRGILRDEGARILDRLLARVARGRGALDVAIGERLDALSAGDRVLRLGYSGLGDYARERLGIAGRTAQEMARLARELRDRPLLAAAVRSGEVSARKARTVLPLARGGDEARWVARARADTVRALEAAVREEAAARASPGAGAEAAAPAEPGAAGAPAGGGPDDEPWERVITFLEPGQRERLEEAMALAGRVLGAAAPRWQRLEAICQEYLGSHPAPEGGEEMLIRSPVADWLEGVKAYLEVEMRRWWFLEELPPVPAPAATSEIEPDCLDAELRGLCATGDRWDELVGHLALLVRYLGLWREMGFASFSHYTSERLGMGVRAVEQRIALERRLYELPALRKAMREGRVSYEKARLLASHLACGTGGDEQGQADVVDSWIARAEKMSCVALRRAVEAAADDGAQTCAPRDLDLRMPARVANLLAAAISAVQDGSDRWLKPGECIERIAAHFVDTWQGQLPRRRTLAHRVLDRDRGFCQVPGCSRAGGHAHHIVHRSRGGGDEPWNLVSACVAHHLHGIHYGYVRVTGRAPDALRWELGVRPGRRPLVVVEPDPPKGFPRVIGPMPPSGLCVRCEV
jgi:hypothetical protein